MLNIFNAILEEPLKGLLLVLYLFCAYLWREQGKIEERLDQAKLDKSTFKTYKKDHEQDHKSHENYFKMIIDLIKGDKK